MAITCVILQVPSHGLLNIIAAPHLGESSTYRALYVHKEDDTADCTLAAHLAGTGCGGGSSSGTAAAAASSSEGSSSSSSRADSGSKRLHKVNVPSSPVGGEAGKLLRAGIRSESGKNRSSIGRAKREKVQQEQRRNQSQAVSHQAVTQQAANQTSTEEKTRHHGRETLANDLSVQQTTALLASLGFKPKVSGHWHSGLPRLDLSIKDSPEAWKAGIQLPLVQLDVGALKVRGRKAGWWV